MSLSTSEAIFQEYRTATREHLAGQLKHEIDWERFRKIEEDARQRLSEEDAAWQRDYHARLAEARQIILREVHGDVLEEPRREAARKVPDRKTLDAMAEVRVRKDHERRLAVIKRDEIDQYEALRKELRTRDRLQGFAAHEFNQARTRPGPSRD